MYKYRIYKCEWKIGDVYAYRFESEIAKEKGYYGRYLLIQKVDEGSWYPGHVVPIVYFRLTKDTSLPSIDDIKNIECVKIAVGEKIPQKNYDYRGKLVNSSKKIIPKSLIYIGNVNVIKPKEEFQHTNDISYFNFSWNNIEKSVIESIELFNLN